MSDAFNAKNTRNPLDIIKVVGASLGCIVFLIVSVAVAWQARHYQIADQPMPNGKGGYMTFRDGYYIASVCFLISVVWFISAYKLWIAARKVMKD
jgi:hypothetical protein